MDPTHFFPTVGWENFDPKHCAVEEGLVDPGERRLLRLTFTSPNFGDGNLILGAPADHPEWYEFSECHGHYHLLGYAEYRIWTLEGYAAWQSERTQRENETAEEVLDEHPELRDEFVAGHKQAFCLIDVTFYVPIPRTYFDCEENQGLTVGWGDTYASSLDGQWIDITGVEAGWYVLEAEVNPEHRIVETDYEDNSGAVLVEIPAS